MATRIDVGTIGTTLFALGVAASFSACVLDFRKFEGDGAGGSGTGTAAGGSGTGTVSYTHLTLPTIYSV